MSEKRAIPKRIIDKFRAVARERITRLNSGIVELEKNPTHAHLSEEVMREIHTLKGDSKIVGFAAINSVSHKVEDLLMLAKGRDFDLSDGLGDLIFSGLDIVGLLIDESVEARETSAEIEEFLLKTDDFRRLEPPAAQGDAEFDSIGERRSEPGEKKRTSVDSPRLQFGADKYVYIHSDKISELSLLLGDMLLTRSRLIRSFRDLSAFLIDERPRAEAQDYSAHDGCKELLSALDHQIACFDKETADLDEKVRALRLVPVSHIFERYPRFIRDLSKESGKWIDFSTSGNNVEIDKQVLDGLSDTILHIIRNAVDHGIESPKLRVERGKSSNGHISIAAKQIGAMIEIVISDDGGGIDFGNVIKKAIERGIISDGESRNLSDAMRKDLIFTPGFSTKNIVGDLSGRGVGLDACKQIMESLNGSIFVDSTPEAGSRFTLRAPLAIAISRLLIVGVSRLKYALPSLAIEKVVRLDPSELLAIGGTMGLRIGSEIIPFVDLGDILGMGRDHKKDVLVTVVLRHRNRLLATSVDSIWGESELVVQPLDPFFSKLKLFSSTVTLVDTDLVPVISPTELFRIATEKRKKRISKKMAPVAKNVENKTVLVVDDSDITRELIVEIIGAMGHKTVDASNGEEALSRLSDHHIDLILSDLEMPVMDGLELISRVRAQSSTKDVPFVILSTRGSDDDKRLAMEKGADSYIVKSEFREQHLYDTINHYLGSQRLS